MKSKIAEFFSRLTEARRRRYKTQNQKRLTNKTPTIICNNCISGAIYRDMDLQYLSPTANVLIHADDYFRFLNHLEVYLTCIPEEIFLEGISYPVGVLKRGDEQVVLRFMHDDSFESAKEKWIARSKRVDFNNLYIIYQNNFTHKIPFLRKSYKRYKAFKALKYPNKRMLLNILLSFDKEVVPMRKAFFSHKGSMLEYPTRFSKKRRMDQFDYVSFLNSKHG